VIDTIGAGDAFAAGYLAARFAGADLSSAAARGVAVASAAISTSPRAYGPVRADLVLQRRTQGSKAAKRHR
jgi:sugar/nucleoside kinase (ribokinase family)